MSTHADPSAARCTIDVGAVFAAYHDTLCASVRRVVGTSDANVEDACMFAWVTVLDRELEQPDGVRGWLFTVAVREAIRLDRRSRLADGRDARERGRRDPQPCRPPRPDPHPRADHRCRGGDPGRGPDRTPGPDRRPTVLGFTYQEIAAHSDDSLRTVERQILRARRELADAHAGHEGEGG